MEYSNDVLLENVKDAFQNSWLWIPLAIITFYILIKNNSWKKTLLNSFSLLFLLLICLWVDKYWKGEKEEFVSTFFAVGCFLLYLLQSKKLVIPVFLSFIGLFVVFQDVNVMIWQFIQGALISSCVYLLNIYIVTHIFKERKNYISVEYTKGGYQVGDVNLFILFLCLTLYSILLISLYNLMRL